MDEVSPSGTAGPFEARYLAFLEAIVQLRPSLHRYCSRMTGSVLDGEDVVQEALFRAFRKLDAFDESRPLAPWLFRIAHNQCIDYLRRVEVRKLAESEAAAPPSVAPVEPVGPALGRAVEHLVMVLPPMERACVLLKDIFDYPLEEVAELVDSSVGGVKAALHRGRSKLATTEHIPPPAPHANEALKKLLREYVRRFNQRDWVGLQKLISADARLRVADRFAGRLSDSPYFGRYERLTLPWLAAAGELEGEPVVVILHPDNGGWAPKSIVRISTAGHVITGIVEYMHCSWILPAAQVSHLAWDS